MQVPVRGKNDPPPCDPEIYHKGELIAVLDAGIPSTTVEAWVKRIARLGRVRVDWHIEGGYPQVLHLGDDHSYARAMNLINNMNGHGGIKVTKTYPRGRISHFRRDR